MDKLRVNVGSLVEGRGENNELIDAKEDVSCCLYFKCRSCQA